MSKKRTKRPTETEKTAPKKPPVKKPYRLEISFNDDVFTSVGSTLAEMLQGFVASSQMPLGFKTKVIIKFSKDGAERMRILGVPVARRIFNRARIHPESLEIFAGVLNSEFNG